MSKLYDALERAIEALMGDSNTLTTTADDLRGWVWTNEDIRPPVGDVDEALRDMHRAGRIKLFAEGFGGSVDIKLSARPRHAHGVSSTSIHVSGGHVQVGNHNQQSITYGNILQSLTEVIERAPNIPEKDKHDLMSKLDAFASHPLLQTILTAAVTIGSSR